MGAVLKKYRVMLLVVIVTGLSMFAVSCGSDPTSDFIDACVTNNTAGVVFENRGASTVDAYLDRQIIVEDLAPGSKSGTFTVSVGTHYTQFFQPNTGTPVSGERSDYLAQCNTYTFYMD